MNLTRKYKLHKLGIPMESKILEIFEFVESRISNLYPFKMVEFPDFVFYMDSSNLNILQYCTLNRCLSIRYNGLWDYMEREYSLKYDDIQSFLQNQIEEYYKPKFKSTVITYMIHIEAVEHAYSMTKNTR